jgi:acetyl-CoA C-acetyltransferase
MMSAAGRVTILGGVRIPFARQNTNYAAACNLDMLTATLKGVVERFGLEGRQLGEVAAGAVLKHTRDFNLTRDARLASGLAPETPAYDVQLGRNL